MPEILTKKEAIEYLGLDDKTFENFFRNADEFKALPRPNGRGRFKFLKEELDEWQNSRAWRTVELTKEDYAHCLDFALAQHFKGYVMSDWGTGRQREFGQKVTNWVKGQLAEVAVKKFFETEFNTEVVLDFKIYDDIVPQDIIGVVKNNKTKEPKIGIGIKSSKPKISYLVLSENEVLHEDRKSDFYIFCRPDMPDDHLLRITKEKIIEIIKNQQHYPSYKDKIPDFTNIQCEIAGWCAIDELKQATSIPGQDFDGVRYVKKTGQLHRSRKEWANLIKKL
ncbi:MAG: hypothetical protein ABIB04_02780 [Patescibacteria group bacterium]